MRRISLLPIGSILLIFIMNFIHIDGAAVMSIDLGNEWMKVGVVSPGVPMEIALNKESKRKTPAILAFRDGIRTFGEDAQSIGVRFPASAYSYLLDLLGKTVDNPIVKLYKKRFPYYEIVPDDERRTVVFKNGDDLFRVEELVAQFLMKAREFAEDSTGQPITECVLIVPGFFGQAERAALLVSAQLANLKVLQLINDYTAVALNYGVFRGTQFNESAQYFLFYDMGAQKTSAALVSYQLIKDKATRETNPVIQVLGVGYDRTLGGLEIQLRLRDFLAKEFNKMKKTKTDVFKNPRALAKLFKEAGRLKNVLSANSDHYAQIENLIEDHDFKFQVTREQLEEMCTDLWSRLEKPLQQSLKMAGLTLDVVNQVILVGGGTRVPKVQDVLRDVIKQELGKNLNADEAATMGAVYKAADLATGFKVKKFIVKDAVIFPIQVQFERETDDGNRKQVKRILFGQMNTYPQKKVITFNKNFQDFDFYVNYADLTNLNEDEIAYIGNLNLSHVELKGIAEIYEENTKTDNIESKGIKSHFTLDDSGIFSLTGVDFVFEKQKLANEDDGSDESTLSKLGNTISKLFSGETSKTEEKKDETVEEQPIKSDEDEKLNENETDKKSDKKDDDTNTTTTPPTATDDQPIIEQMTKNVTIKIVTVKEPVEYKLTQLFTLSLDGKSYEKSFKKLDDLNTADMQRTRRESAFNTLESYVIEAQDRLTRDEFSSCANDDEKQKIKEECEKIAEWLYGDGEDSDAETYEKRLNDLKKLTNEVYAKHWEHEERPEALKALDGMIDGARKFLESAKNLTKDVNPDKDVFTDVEIETLKKTIDETVEWQKLEIKAQKKLKRNEPVRLTVKLLADKMSLLDREVKYLVNKIKIWRPKKTTPPKKDDKLDTNETKTSEQDGDEKKEEQVLTDGDGVDPDVVENTGTDNYLFEENAEEQVEGVPTKTDDIEIKDKKKQTDKKPDTSNKKKTDKKTTTERDPETQTPHGEL